MTDVIEGGRVLSDYTPFISPVIGPVISAGVAWVTAKAVTKRSNLRNAFEEILDDLDEVHEKATQLLLISGAHASSNLLFRQIGLADYRIGRRLTEVCQGKYTWHKTRPYAPVPGAIERARIPLRKLVTDTDLIDIARPAYAAADPLFNDLNGKCDGLRKQVRICADEFGVKNL